jgi:hypothetical protein
MGFYPVAVDHSQSFRLFLHLGAKEGEKRKGKKI